MQCQVCGREEFADVVAEMGAYDPDWIWMMHSIELKGGYVRVLTCHECATATQSLILESYKERIRQGLVAGYH